VVGGARRLKVLAETGHALSQLRLALLYHVGQGMPRDYRKAANWYAKAAEQG
jgi:TPR repeat protein